MSGAEPVPVDARVRLAHGYLQHLADACGADLLHVKGPATDSALRPSESAWPSSDADVLVRPAHVARLLSSLADHGWVQVTGFAEGSAFGHATNLRHTYLGMVDVHRSWPGFTIPADQAFAALWDRRSSLPLAHVACPVPDQDSQRVLLLTHAGRSGGTASRDYDPCWLRASEEQRARVRELVEQFGAEVALAAAIGELDRYRGHWDYQLWRSFAGESAGSRLAEWRGRWQSARGWRAKAQVTRCRANTATAK